MWIYCCLDKLNEENREREITFINKGTNSLYNVDYLLVFFFYLV